MKNRKYLLFVALVAAITACTKYKNLRDDTKGLLYIHGRLYVADTLTKTGPYVPTPFGAATIKIGYARDNANNYIYSVQADSNGYFTFTNLSADSSYVIFCKTTQNGAIFYQQRPYQLTTSLDTTILTLYPSKNWQNGLVYTVTDSGNPPQPLNSCQVCLFKSQILFQADTCYGASYVLMTNPYGAAYQLNVPSGQYYALFKDSISSKLVLHGKDTITVNTTGITRTSIKLK